MADRYSKYDNFEPGPLDLQAAYAKWHRKRMGVLVAHAIMNGGELKQRTPRLGKHAHSLSINGVRVK